MGNRRWFRYWPTNQNAELVLNRKMDLSMRNSRAYPIPVQPQKKRGWPESWDQSHHYDCLEVWYKNKWCDFSEIGYVRSYASRRSATIEAVLAAAPPPARVLDIASAQGNFAIALAQLGYSVTWNDLRNELADYVRLKLPADTKLQFAEGNIFDLGEEHVGAYDVVLATEIIEHVAHPDRFMANLARLLRPGGCIVLSTPNGGYFLNFLPRFSDCPDPSVNEKQQFKPNSDGHIYLMHEDELRDFARNANLKVAGLDFITNPLTAGHLKLRYLLAFLPETVVSGIEVITRALPRVICRVLAVHIICVFRAQMPSAIELK